jgi:hypothetical protein
MLDTRACPHLEQAGYIPRSDVIFREQLLLDVDEKVILA